MYPRWVSFHTDILSKKYEFKDLELKFDAALEQYIEYYKMYGSRMQLDEQLKRMLLKNHISANSTIYSQKVESIDLQPQQIMANDLLDGNTMIEWSTANMLYHQYNNTSLKDPFTIWDLREYHAQVNKFDRKIRPGVIRNPKTNPVNVEIKAAGKVFVEFQEVKKQLDRLMKFINFNDTHPAIKSAIIHGYLVGIHPFNDGNGRMSRFVADKYLERATGEKIYCSEAIYSDLKGYYKALEALHLELDVKPIVEFIVKAQIQQMKNNNKALLETGDKALFIRTKLKASDNIKESYIDKLVFTLLNYHAVTNKNVMYQLNVSKITAAKIIKELMDLNILEEGIKGGRTVIYELKEDK